MVIGNSNGEGDIKGQNFLKEGMKLNWNFQRGGAFKPKYHPWGEYGYFLQQHISILWYSFLVLTDLCLDPIINKNSILVVFSELYSGGSRGGPLLSFRPNCGLKG